MPAEIEHEGTPMCRGCYCRDHVAMIYPLTEVLGMGSSDASPRPRSTPFRWTSRGRKPWGSWRRDRDDAAVPGVPRRDHVAMIYHPRFQDIGKGLIRPRSWDGIGVMPTCQGW